MTIINAKVSPVMPPKKSTIKAQMVDIGKTAGESGSGISPKFLVESTCHSVMIDASSVLFLTNSSFLKLHKVTSQVLHDRVEGTSRESLYLQYHVVAVNLSRFEHRTAIKGQAGLCCDIFPSTE